MPHSRTRPSSPSLPLHSYHALILKHSSTHKHTHLRMRTNRHAGLQIAKYILSSDDTQAPKTPGFRALQFLTIKGGRFLPLPLGRILANKTRGLVSFQKCPTPKLRKESSKRPEKSLQTAFYSPAQNSATQTKVGCIMFL